MYRYSNDLKVWRFCSVSIISIVNQKYPFFKKKLMLSHLTWLILQNDIYIYLSILNIYFHSSLRCAWPRTYQWVTCNYVFVIQGSKLAWYILSLFLSDRRYMHKSWICIYTVYILWMTGTYNQSKCNKKQLSLPLAMLLITCWYNWWLHVMAWHFPMPINQLYI